MSSIYATPCRCVSRYFSQSFCGGTLRGVIEKLDYLSKLGVDALWLSPFCKTDYYHGYAITDYFSVEPRFGTLLDLKELIASAHARGIKIIADFVPNHCSATHPFFLQAQADKDSPYHSWFTFTRWPDEYACFLQHRFLVKINLSNPAARSHIIEAAKYWLSLGIDGYRLDHVIGVSHDFWRAFRREIKVDFPHSPLIGEVWLDWITWRDLKNIKLRNKFWKFLLGTSAEKVYREYIGQLDGVLDFAVHKLICKYFAGGPQPNYRALQSDLARHFNHFPRDFILPVFLDNHDMDRFLYTCGGDRNKLRAAAALLFSLKQPVILYYGTETGMSQPCSINDPNGYGHGMIRQPMPWTDIDGELFTFFQELIQERKARRAADECRH